MTKKELKSMIQEVAREEVYRVLPDLLKEAVTETLTEITTKPKRQQSRRKKSSPQKLTKRSILEEIGYHKYGIQEDHDNDETYHFDSRDVGKIAQHAGVPVDVGGGLREYETSMGQGGYSEIDPDMVEAGVAPIPQSMGGEEMPDFLANAINKAKDVVDRVSEMESFRPGMK